ncbi:MAG: cell division protein FtsQ/DivIB [Flavisolibacter sp.]
MERKRVIRKVLVLAAWFVVIGGLTTLLIAANRKKTEHVCKQIVVSIKGSGEKFYVEEADILSDLNKTTAGSLIDKPLTNIPLSLLEKKLEKDQWIRNAELYFDREDVLHVSVEEREPIARIFTTGGSSFYIDSSGHQIPLLDKVSVRLPVITGYTNVKKLSAKDSALLDDVKLIAKFVYADPFWNAQIGQIDITDNRKFELIPVIGDHIIRIGDAENLKEKLSRLLLFYKQVMSKTGFNKYSVVDVQYDGQVVGVNKGPVSKVDSIQLQKNIKELLERSTIQNVSDEMLPDAKSMAQTDSIQISMTAQNNSVSVKTNPNPANSIDPISEKPAKKSIPIAIGATDKTKGVKTSKKPKAVMTKRG